MDRFQYSAAMARHGYEKIGEGMYASVYAFPGSSRVVKVSRDVAWLAFMLWGQDTPYVPKLYSVKWHASSQGDYFVAVMERVTPAADKGIASSLRYTDYYTPEVRAFVKAADAAGFRTTDIHEGNYGFRDDGSVAIFDPTGWQSDVDNARDKFTAQTRSVRYRTSPRVASLAMA